MKRTKYILLFIGIAGLAAAVFGMLKGDAFTDHIITLVCGSSLIYGYFEIKKQETK